MSSTASEVDICNLALGWLGEDTISSFTQAGKVANLCKLNYPRARGATLEAREWTFAVESRVLAVDPTAPDFYWSYRYQIPTSWLRVLTVNGEYLTNLDSLTSNLVTPEQLSWEREGDFILTNQDDTINARAIKLITDTAKYSESFVNALAARIAWYLTIPITSNRNLQADMFALYNNMLRDAASTDGLQGRSRRVRSRYLASRR